MVARDSAQEHRVSTPLELLFDLCFVVAVAQAGTQLRHAFDLGNVAALVDYGTVFFAIWWAWVNFTWFASTYDTDDVLYRVTTLVQITGALVMAAGVPQAFNLYDFRIVVIGYAIMRIGLVGQWTRAAYSYPPGRRTALRYAAGVSLCWIGWVVLLTMAPAELRLPLWPVMAVAELSVPLFARRAGASPWHPRHIAERYSLFTLIVLGESVLAAVVAVQNGMSENEISGSLLGIAGGGLLTVFAMWWLYFAKPAHDFLRSSRVGFVWGYGHLFVFASAAAVGVGIAVNVDRLDGQASLSEAAAGLAFTGPLAVFLFMVWLLHLRPHGRALARNAVLPVVAVALPAISLLDQPVLVAGLVVAALVGFTVITAESPTSRSTPPHMGKSDSEAEMSRGSG